MVVFSFPDSSVKLEQRRAVAASRYVPKATQAVPQVEVPEVASGADLVSEALYRAEAERELDEEEELFNLEEDIAQPMSYNWEDKYRPRKPRYFNRVHTGYEWNKYNQTHYEYIFLIRDMTAILIFRLAVWITLRRKLCKVTRHAPLPEMVVELCLMCPL